MMFFWMILRSTGCNRGRGDLPKESALFVPSGTMGNQIAINVHTTRDRKLSRKGMHTFLNLKWLQWLRSVESWPGRFRTRGNPGLGKDSIRHPAENLLPGADRTDCAGKHAQHGGWDRLYQAQIDDICDHAHDGGLPVHLDGARIFNAATALDTDVASLTARCDSIMFCLSKGLAAPVGSMLIGSNAFVERARSVRKMLGGGMRQAGVLAAAGLIALEKMPARLVEDHRNARLMADLLSKTAGWKSSRRRCAPTS